MGKTPNTEPEPELPETRIVTPEADAQPQVTKIVTPDEEVAKPGKFDVGDMMGSGPSMPTVQQHAIEAARADASASQANNAPRTPIKGKTDDLGREFDPKMHEGATVLNREGYLKKRPGRGSAAPRAASSAPSGQGAAGGQSKLNLGSAPAGPDKKTQAAEELDAKIQSTAAVSAMMIFTVGQLVGGPEFKPEDSEAQAMTGAFTEYYRVRGIVDLPPEVMLATAVVGYVIPRWNKPIFKEKRQGWWARWKSRKAETNYAPGAIRPEADKKPN